MGSVGRPSISDGRVYPFGALKPGGGYDSWTEQFGDIKDPEVLNKVKDQYGPQYEESREKELELYGEIVSLYGAMLATMKSHLWLAEPSTIKLYPKLVDHVEVWRRTFILPQAFSKIYSHDSNLNELYEEIEKHFLRLTGRKSR